MRILIDADGVMFDFASAFLEVRNALVEGPPKALEDIRDHDFVSAGVVTPAQNSECWREISRSPGLVRTLRVYPGVPSALRALRAATTALGGCLVCVTSPARGVPFWVEERTEALEALGFTRQEIVFASDKSHVFGDVLIEDHPGNLRQWQAAHSKGRCHLIDRPWNAQSDHPAWRRHRSLRALTKHLKLL